MLTHIIYGTIIAILSTLLWFALPYAKAGYDQSVIDARFPHGAVPAVNLNELGE